MNVPIAASIALRLDLTPEPGRANRALFIHLLIASLEIEHIGIQDTGLRRLCQPIRCSASTNVSIDRHPAQAYLLGNLELR